MNTQIFNKGGLAGNFWLQIAALVIVTLVVIALAAKYVWWPRLGQLDWIPLRQLTNCPAQAMVCGTSSGSLAMFAAMRRASSRVTYIDLDQGIFSIHGRSLGRNVILAITVSNRWT
jgi:hypothetical protein